MVQEYIALDLETTGLNPGRDRILEIGAVRVREGEVKEIYSVLVNCGQTIPERITELTGISNGMMEEAIRRGEALETARAVEQLLEFCGGLPILGHNILFDYSFVKRQAVNMGRTFEASGVDTLKIARRFLAELPGRSLGELCRHYGISQERSHRAADDAMAASALYQRMAEEFEAAQPEAFLPQPLIYRVKKQGPITKFQKAYLIDLVKYHRIDLNVSIDSLTKNEASRLIDQILFSYGKIKRC